MTIRQAVEKGSESQDVVISQKKKQTEAGLLREVTID